MVSVAFCGFSDDSLKSQGLVVEARSAYDHRTVCHSEQLDSACGIVQVGNIIGVIRRGNDLEKALPF